MLYRYVLSTTHLHEFKSPDRIATQTPVMSLLLADQKLGSHSSSDSTSHKFMLKGRQAGGIHRGHAWVFRAESFDTMLAWFEDIKNLTEKTGAERNEFIRRTHARSLSAGSYKAGSVSSDGLDEDEADQVPYSATPSQVEITAQEEKLPERPDPGGRFPSQLTINRGSQVSHAPSSPSSSDDREVVAAAALPGSGIPFGSSGQQVQAGDDETGDLPGELGGAKDDVPEADTYVGMKPHSPVYRSLPHHVERHESKYGDWMGPAAIGAGDPADIEAYRRNQEQDKQPGLQPVEPAAQPSASPVEFQPSATQPVQGAIFAAIPPSTGVTDEAKTTRTPASEPADPGAPIRDLANRPPLGSHDSVATITELHVPGEFPRVRTTADT